MSDLVALSLLTLVPQISGGTETYARRLCEALSRVGTMRYRAYVPTIAPDAAGPLPSEVVPEYHAARTVPGRILAMAEAALLPKRIGKRLVAEQPDVVHFPLSVLLPRIHHPAVVTTIHDVQHEFFPKFFSHAELAYRRAVYGWTVRRSRMIITISDHAREAMIERFGLPPASVRRIYNGVDHGRFRPSSLPREPFLLYPANRWAHKNHDRLLQAFALMRKKRPELRLVLTGAGHEAHAPAEGVVVRGHVPFEELLRLYATASAMVYPSLYEGFGLPVLEAMASGCPVACSNTAALPEVAGEAAMLFNPYSPESIAEATLRVLQSPQAFVAAGLAQAAKFTWEATAREHDEVYRAMAVRPS